MDSNSLTKCINIFIRFFPSNFQYKTKLIKGGTCPKTIRNNSLKKKECFTAAKKLFWRKINDWLISAFPKKKNRYINQLLD